MQNKAPLSPPDSDGLSRRRVLSYLGWGASAPTLLAGGALPEWGELRLPGLPRGALLPQGEAIRLSSNENPYGMCAAARALWGDVIEDANRYPFRWEAQLIAAIAEHHSASESNLIAGAGSTESLRMCSEAWLSPERGLVEANPTFETLGFYARAAKVPVRSIALDADGRHDLQAMLDAIDETTAAVYVCNPGNPASTLMPQADVDAFIDAVPGNVIVLVDEAYHHFVDAPDYVSQVDRALDSENVIVIRTFSKIYGMAGMRVGYAVGHPERIRELQAPRTEMSVSVPAAVCATASLRDAEYPVQQKRLNTEARAILTDGLDRLGVPYWESETNFVMAHLDRPMMPVNRSMARDGVLVGRLFPALPQGLRISIGTDDQMGQCVDALARALA